MRIRNTILYTILCCTLASQSAAASHYKIQLGVFVKKIPFTHFAFSGVNDICMDTDKNNVHHYYLRTTFEKYPVAKRVKDLLVARGFSTASVISIDESEVVIPETISPELENKYSKVIHYGFNQSELSSSSKNDLKSFVEKVKAHPNIRIALIGHSDSKGDAKYNVELSKNRVRAVKRYLIKKGISKNQFIAKACGESSPVCSNVCEQGLDLPENRKLNRRVLICCLNLKGEIINQIPTAQTVHPILEREDRTD